ncbi:glycine dehydrogenase [Geosmithia morbida]|uniref:Glycine cleavage system P protein n=1 Tax=Geosmithia morbida TaxID=1094350 RepID=A0A9P5D301_9HYPO|nr:glycine dehydrogenase [Geosmithia morbida]KAF4124412.1 glycine dehydrogenase [Geosmithia morbida]
MASRLASVRGLALSSTSSVTLGARVGRSAAAASAVARAPVVSLVSRRHVHDEAGGSTPDPRVKVYCDEMRDILFKNTPPWVDFHTRHIGPRDSDVEEMLRVVGAGSGLDDLVAQVVPKDVIQPPTERIARESFMSEERLLPAFTYLVEKNKKMDWMIGQGYYPVHTPAVIKRNILESPAWYTSYTPYQAEISQGRLQSLLNYQTMVSDLTGLPVANASLLDEGTAGAEAMLMSYNTLPGSRQKRKDKTYIVSDKVNPTTVGVLEHRAQGFGITVKQMDLSSPDAPGKLKELGQDLVGAMVQYPDTDGNVDNFRPIADAVHELGAQLSAATDLSALTILTPPGEWGADIAFGNSQRFGVPLGGGGPHAAFFATKEANKRRIPGRLVGVTKDRLGRPALRLALQTREQHIRREKATSNVCTAQALLANMAAMYAIYHGPAQLRAKALENLRGARMIQKAALYFGYKAPGSPLQPEGLVLSDTVTLQGLDEARRLALLSDLNSRGVGVNSTERGTISFSVSENLTPALYRRIVGSLRAHAPKNESAYYLQTAKNFWQEGYAQTSDELRRSIPAEVKRESEYLTHPVFNTYHSETEMLRYIHHLQSKDLSQVHSMIPLGSCTMKLNGTSQLELITVDKNANMHPLAGDAFTEGYADVIASLCQQLSSLTGMDATSIQPNSGAQGEYAGLRVIRKYHETRGDTQRDICLIPVSAHGTNPASAAMAGMRTVPIKCIADTGNLDIEDLKEKCAKYADQLGAIMITYPSTYGIFEPGVREVCDIVHQHGGQVYMDGANMNAQIGLTSPGGLGADVCHLNLHKTFCIPHGGGGPGVGPIAVKSHLQPMLQEATRYVTSAKFGSASILPISWAYIRLMRDEGLLKATKTALLNANYLLARLKDHYTVAYTNAQGRCAHEFIIDARPFGKTAGIEVADIAKRLQDYGFHSPTMSWPVPGTLMIEPTESESKEELDRFADALISIRQEIREIEEGKQPREGNVLKMAPHPQIDLIRGDGEGKWDRPYSREKAAYPLPYLIEKKFWPTVGRADDTYGDTNLFCTCPPVEDTT